MRLLARALGRDRTPSPTSPLARLAGLVRVAGGVQATLPGLSRLAPDRVDGLPSTGWGGRGGGVELPRSGRYGGAQAPFQPSPRQHALGGTELAALALNVSQNLRAGDRIHGELAVTATEVITRLHDASIAWHTADLARRSWGQAGPGWLSAVHGDRSRGCRRFGPIWRRSSV